MRQHRRAIFWLLMGLLAACPTVGCQSILTSAAPTTFAHEMRREQIVLHSDFALVEQEQLISELCAQRELLAAKLQLPPTDAPIHIYLFADERDYYDFLAQHFPNFPARRAIFVETNVELTVYAHWGEHVAEDLRHEVTHGYLHAAIPHLPLWLDEGLAEYFEVGADQHGLNKTHLNYLLGQEKIQPNLARLEQLTAAADMTQQDYAESWAWVHYLLESSNATSELLTDYLADLQQGDRGSFNSQLQQPRFQPELAVASHLRTFSH